MRKNMNKYAEVIVTYNRKKLLKENIEALLNQTFKDHDIASLNTEIASIQKAIEEQKNTLKEKKAALRKAEKEVASLKKHQAMPLS